MCTHAVLLTTDRKHARVATGCAERSHASWRLRLRSDHTRNCVVATGRGDDCDGRAVRVMLFRNASAYWWPCTTRIMGRSCIANSFTQLAVLWAPSQDADAQSPRAGAGGLQSRLCMSYMHMHVRTGTRGALRSHAKCMQARMHTDGEGAVMSRHMQPRSCTQDKPALASHRAPVENGLVHHSATCICFRGAVAEHVSRGRGAPCCAVLVVHSTTHASDHAWK